MTHMICVSRYALIWRINDVWDHPLQFFFSFGSVILRPRIISASIKVCFCFCASHTCRHDPMLFSSFICLALSKNHTRTHIHMTLWSFPPSHLVALIVLYSQLTAVLITSFLIIAIFISSIFISSILVVTLGLYMSLYKPPVSTPSSSNLPWSCLPNTTRRCEPWSRNRWCPSATMPHCASPSDGCSHVSTISLCKKSYSCVMPHGAPWSTLPRLITTTKWHVGNST